MHINWEKPTSETVANKFINALSFMFFHTLLLTEIFLYVSPSCYIVLTVFQILCT